MLSSFSEHLAVLRALQSLVLALLLSIAAFCLLVPASPAPEEPSYLDLRHFDYDNCKYLQLPNTAFHKQARQSNVRRIANKRLLVRYRRRFDLPISHSFRISVFSGIVFPRVLLCSAKRDMSITLGQLRTACIDCTKYDPDERSSEILALTCHAAYLTVVFLASVSPYLYFFANYRFFFMILRSCSMQLTSAASTSFLIFRYSMLKRI